MKRDLALRPWLPLCILLLLLCSLAPFPLYAGAESAPEALPAPIKALLLKIKSDMTDSEVLKIVQETYPDAKMGLGDWSGQTGYVDYRLGQEMKGYSISIACMHKYKTKNGVILREQDAVIPTVVHPSFLVYVYKFNAKQKAIVTFNEKHEICVEVMTWK